ncbi:hypothetical protein NC652_022528 [Populus alba x Populus x berolinensis]|nr:hypothetical protein NC652_022528 [Populus alba x Populus x berolinensis]
MASHRIGETGLSDSGPSNQHLPYALLRGINTPSTSFMYVAYQLSNFLQFLQVWLTWDSCIFAYSNQEGSAFDFGELEEAIVLEGVKIRNDEAKAPLFTVTGRPAATLEMFPSWPMRFQETPRVVVS